MANNSGSYGFRFFVLIGLTVVASVTMAAKEEEGTLFEFAQTLLQESVRNQNSGSGINMLGGIVQGLMQGDGGKQLGDMLSKGGRGGAADVIANLASVWQASQGQAAGSSGGKQEASFDPSVLGSMVDLLSTLSKATDADNNNVDENNNDKQDFVRSKANSVGSQEPSENWEALLSVAGNLISSMSNQGPQADKSGSSSGGLESFLSFLPVLMNSMSGQHNAHASHSMPHHTHSQFLPPFLENLHEYWDHFLTTEFGRSLWENSGLAELVKDFQDGRGQVRVDKVFESLENHGLRRKWIRGSSKFLADWLKHLTNPDTQKRYLETVQIVGNSFLQAQGYPKDTLFNTKNPGKSLSSLVNAVFKRQFGLKVNSENYVVPAVGYIQELFKSGQKSGMGFFKLSSNDLESKLSSTMDGDVIDPVLRVYRGYKFALKTPQCAKYVLCTLNESDGTKSSLKPGITKASSLAAAWFLSESNNNQFWDLYAAAVDGGPCHANLKADWHDRCGQFVLEDTKATTEYYHNEL